LARQLSWFIRSKYGGGMEIAPGLEVLAEHAHISTLWSKMEVGCMGIHHHLASPCGWRGNATPPPAGQNIGILLALRRNRLTLIILDVISPMKGYNSTEKWHGGGKSPGPPWIEDRGKRERVALKLHYNASKVPPVTGKELDLDFDVLGPGTTTR